MPGKAILIAGYPGSGKSTHGKQLKSEINAQEYIDDYRENSVEHNAAFDHGRKYNELIAGLKQGQTWIASDIEWCRPKIRQEAEAELRKVPDVIIEWHFMKCDKDVCRKRVLDRGYKKYTKELEENPDPSRKKEVWVKRCKKVSDQLEAIARLSREGDIPLGSKVIPSC